MYLAHLPILMPERCSFAKRFDRVGAPHFWGASLREGSGIAGRKKVRREALSQPFLRCNEFLMQKT